MRLPPKKRPGNPILAKDWNQLIDALEARTPRPSHGMELVFTSAGFSYRARRTGNDAVTAPPCPFGEIITIPDSDPVAKGIRGGVIQCGGNNWDIESHEISLTTAGVWLVSIAVDVVVMMDDDGEILLPGIASATRPTSWTLTAWTSGTDYPGNTNPTVASGGEGTCVVPIGRLTVEIPDGSPPGTKGTATFERVDCGPVWIAHCSGNLNAWRGPIDFYY